MFCRRLLQHAAAVGRVQQFSLCVAVEARAGTGVGLGGAAATRALVMGSGELCAPLQVDGGSVRFAVPLTSGADGQLHTLLLDSGSTVDETVAAVEAVAPDGVRGKVVLRDEDGTRFAGSSQLAHAVSRPLILSMGSTMVRLVPQGFSSARVDTNVLASVSSALGTPVGDDQYPRSKRSRLVADVAAACGLTHDEVEHAVEQLVDEGLLCTAADDGEEYLLAPEGLPHGVRPTAGVSALNTKLQAWLATLAAAKEDTSRIEGLRDQVQHRVSRSALWKKLAVLAGMGAQFAVLFYYVYDVYSWDVMEPFSYFLGVFYSLGAAVYFSVTKRDATYDNLLEATESKASRKVSKRVGYDQDEHRSSIERVAVADSAVELLRSRAEEAATHKL